MCFTGVNTDEIESSADDWDEVTVEILIDEEDIIMSEENKDWSDITSVDLYLAVSRYSQ